jgi:hypothetical protein
VVVGEARGPQNKEAPASAGETALLGVRVGKRPRLSGPCGRSRRAPCAGGQDHPKHSGVSVLPCKGEGNSIWQYITSLDFGR